MIERNYPGPDGNGMRRGAWLPAIAFHRLYNTDFCVVAKCKRALTSEKLSTPDIFEADLALHVGTLVSIDVFALTSLSQRHLTLCRASVIAGPMGLIQPKGRGLPRICCG